MDFDRFAQWMRARSMAETTIHTRTVFAASRLRDWGTLDVTPEQAKAVYARAELGKGTRATYFENLRALFAWALEDGLISKDPLAGVPCPPMVTRRPRPLSPVEVRRALDAATGDVRAFMLLGLFAGLRAHEIAKIRGEDVTREVIFVQGKGGKTALIPTHPELWALAASMPRVGPWFPSPAAHREHICPATVGAKMSRHFRALGIVGSSHRNRHVFGTTLLREGVNLRVIQELMRHSSLATTAAYLGVDEDEKRDAISRLHAA